MNIVDIKTEYEKHIEREKEKIELRKNSILLENPDIKKMQDKINQLDYKRVQLVLNGLTEDIDKITKEIKSIEKLKEKKIKELNLPKDYLEIKYKCNICKDKGYIKENGKTIRCKCVTQKLLNERYNNSNLNLDNNETFENFNLKYYSNEKENEEKSPRENMKEIFEISKYFVENFGDKNTKIKNIFFTGKTGLGKTYLSNAIAKELINNGYTVFYQTAPIMLDELMLSKFNDNEEYYNMLNQINIVDLLIIDDLGSENLTESKMKELFSIINNRLIKNKSTLISSNMSLKNLNDSYEDRIFSRIVGNYIIKNFYGQDIRILRKKNKIYE